MGQWPDVGSEADSSLLLIDGTAISSIFIYRCVYRERPARLNFSMKLALHRLFRELCNNLPTQNCLVLIFEY
jgi:hypothetical protein